MPLSPDLRKRLQAHTGAAEAATDDELVTAAAVELDARKTDMTALVEKTKAMPALSADVARLQGELDAKTAEVLTLSAGVAPKPDPFVLGMFSETFDAKSEAAIEAGVPKAAVDYFAGLVKGADGTPTVLALSALTVPAADGKVKNTRLGIALIDGLAKLAKGGFGAGVATGFAKGGTVVLQASGEATDEIQQQLDAERQQAEAWKKQELASRGVAVA